MTKRNPELFDTVIMHTITKPLVYLSSEAKLDMVLPSKKTTKNLRKILINMIVIVLWIKSVT